MNRKRILHALPGALLAWGMLAPAAQAAGQERTVRQTKVAVKAVQRADGSVVDRLDMAARKLPVRPEEWPQRMADPTRNGTACKDPKAFAEWLDATTEPRFMTALATMAMDPNTYPKALGQLFDPATAHNWSEFTDPVLYLKWMGAGMDPQFYQALFNRLTDSGKLGRWAASPASPEVQALIRAMADPGVYGKWMAQAVDSRTYAPLAQAANPLLPTIWMGGMAQGVSRALSPSSDQQDWHKLPAADAKTNPWLAGSAGYRY
ncbi:MAG: hypothetical protein HZB71_06905 [Betaproteobacteria bacterium]|nr:hypothetical protein [Betaproteobacteria bacterium]